MIVTRGGVFAGCTTSVIPACAPRPPESVTLAVMACIPARRLAVVRLAPVPRRPSRLDDQRSDAPRSPSWESTAVAVRVSGIPAVTVVALGGEVMVTTGGTFGVPTVTVTCACPASPPASTAFAVRTWTPSRSGTTRLAPVPSGPSTLDVQTSALLSVPFSASDAVPARDTGTPLGSLAPPDGVAMVTVGGVFGGRTTTETRACPVRPEESVTDAVTLWVPARSVEVEMPGPVPSGPSRLELHLSAPLRLPSSTSVALPWQTSVPPTMRVVPSGGAVIATTGALPRSVTTSLGAGPASRAR